jgi:hypothetical protein
LKQRTAEPRGSVAVRARVTAGQKAMELEPHGFGHALSRRGPKQHRPDRLAASQQSLTCLKKRTYARAARVDSCSS